MEAIKIKGIAKNGELTISVPDSFNEQELEVIVLSSNNQISRHNSQDPVYEERVKRLMSIVGTAKYLDLSSDIFDVHK